MSIILSFIGGFTVAICLSVWVDGERVRRGFMFHGDHVYKLVKGTVQP